MLELNKWFFVQLANFLILLVLLNIILFKPLLQLFKERDSKTRGFLDEAKKMDEERERLLSEIDKKITAANEEAKKIHEQLYNEGVNVHRECIKQAHEEASKISEEARNKIEAETRMARERLRADVEIFANKIVEKLIRV